MGIFTEGMKSMLGWRELYEACSSCRKCALSGNRTRTVVGEGNIKASLMLVGEAPGADEDRLGKPFVGKAGQLLTKALTALELDRERDYYICNVCKCRPENNRTPLDEETEACLPYLRNQVALVRPVVILCLGATAMKSLISRDWKITQHRGKWVERKGFYMMATFHPAALLRDESKKELFWEDLKEVKKKLEFIKANNR